MPETPTPTLSGFAGVWLLLFAAAMTPFFPIALLVWPTLLAYTWFTKKRPISSLALILLSVTSGMLFGITGGALVFFIVGIPFATLVWLQLKHKGLYDTSLFTSAAILLILIGFFALLSQGGAVNLPNTLAQKVVGMVQAWPQTDTVQKALSQMARYLDWQMNPAATQDQLQAIAGAPAITDPQALHDLFYPALSKFIMQMMPSYMLLTAALWGFFSAFFCLRLRKRYAVQGGEESISVPPFENLFLPRSLVNTLVALLIFTFIGGLLFNNLDFLQVAFRTANALAVSVLAVAGLSCTWFFLKRRRMSFGLFVPLAVLAFILLKDGLMILGLLDQLFGWRRRSLLLESSRKEQDV